MQSLKGIDIFRLESSVWIAARKVNIPAYDFSFEPLFAVSRSGVNTAVPVIARVGAIADYEALFQSLLAYGFRLINSPAQHQLAANLEAWYPLIPHLTPTSKVYTRFPALEELLQDFFFPVFIKGNRQTAKHDATLSIARNPEDYQRIVAAWQQDTILNWQKIVIREYVELEPLALQAVNKVPLSFEFRTFWWKGNLAGAGHYWSQYAAYQWTAAQEKAALAVAAEAASKIQVPFLVIDLALTRSGKWIVIETNDAQESGYSGVPPLQLWQQILELERRL